MKKIGDGNELVVEVVGVILIYEGGKGRDRIKIIFFVLIKIILQSNKIN